MTDQSFNNTVISLFDGLSEEDKAAARRDIAMYGTYYLQAQEDGSVKRINPSEVFRDTTR